MPGFRNTELYKPSTYSVSSTSASLLSKYEKIDKLAKQPVNGAGAEGGGGSGGGGNNKRSVVEISNDDTTPTAAGAAANPTKKRKALPTNNNNVGTI